MPEEEKEAIQQLKSWREFIIKNRDKVNKANDLEFYLRTALNLIQKYQYRLEVANEYIENRKDNMIPEYYDDLKYIFNECDLNSLW